MKRWLGVIAALCLLTASAASAAPDVPYAVDTMLLYPSLNSKQQAIFDCLYQAASAGEPAAELPEGSGKDDAILAFRALLRDCPELYGLERAYSLVTRQNEPEIVLRVELQFSGYTNERALLLEAAGRMAASVSGTEWEKALQLHNLLCETADYGGASRPFEAYDALLRGQAVCEGYANAYTLLCRMAGIRCGQIGGTATDERGATEPHAWNLVVSDEGSFMVDATWDDQSFGVRHWFFGLTDEMIARDHQEEAFLPRPNCRTVGLDWNARLGSSLPAGLSEPELRDWWFGRLDALRERRDAVDVRFGDEASYRLFLERWHEWITAYNDERGRDGLYGGWRYGQYDSQRCFCLQIAD